MNQRRVPHRACVLLALGVTLGLAMDATAAYTRPTTKPPTDADLVMIGGAAKTLVVRILNLTPYIITYDAQNSTVKGTTGSQDDLDRGNAKSMMFAPVGWYDNLPGVMGDWSYDEASASWVFTPEPGANDSLHPYSFVLSWDDNDKHVDNSTMSWNITNVGHGTTLQSVPVRIWITRDNPSDKLRGGPMFELVSNCVSEVIRLSALAIEPENPLAWWDAFLATKELASSGFDAANAQETGGDKMYVAAYAVPDSTSPCYNNGQNCIMSIMKASTGDSNDGVDVQWASGLGGTYSEQILVATQVLRGKDIDNRGCCGSAPIVTITVMTPDEFIWAYHENPSSPLKADPMGRKINSYLHQAKTRGFTQFAHLYRSLGKEQVKALAGAADALHKHHALTQEQKAILAAVAGALEHGRTTLKAESKGEPSHDKHPR